MPNILGIIVGLSCLVGAIVCYTVTGWWSKKTLERRFRRGIKMEARGERLLRRSGYYMESVQRSISASVTLGGKRVSYNIRPDAFVQKGGRRFVAEIKSGHVAGNPMSKDTRRQLLEYHYFAEADGLLFVNADSDYIIEVEFPRFGKKSSPRSYGTALVLILLAFGGGFVFGKIV